MHPLILASSSPYRRELLEKLAIPFTWQSPDVDETPLSGETPIALVQRLALAKARAITPLKPAYIIGSDQVAFCEEKILTKPGTYDKAFEHLSHMSGKKVRFITGLCLLNSETQEYQLDVEVDTLFFRELSPEEINAYIELEKPFDCAASFKFESHGIRLISRVIARDPHAIIGLPLIKLMTMLNNVKDLNQ